MLTNQAKLKEAEEAYFLSGKPIISDDEYDILAEAATREGAGVRPVGARPAAKDACPLPVPMPSLRKVKPGMMRDWEGRKAVVSEKLDGISALWCLPEGRLFLRGDQQYGVEKTAFVPLITGLARPTGKWIVRGEIVVVKNNSADRNIINGYLHRQTPDDGIPSGVMRFVAYSICSLNTTSIARNEQFKMLSQAGFEVAWNLLVSKVKESWLMETMKSRREMSKYAMDGLVVASPDIPVMCAAGDAYPPDAVAFKMPLADQMCSTRIVEIDWNLGRAGIWTPRLRIEPVQIGGACIEWVTGHNASWVKERELGVGAEVIIRRSGDVIPIIDSVIRGVPVGVWPQGGRWEGVHLVQDRAENIATISHAVELMGVKQCGEERLKKLGITTLKDLFELPESVWASEVGPGIGPKLRTELHLKAAETDTIIRTMCYPFLPTAVGRKRLQVWNGSTSRPVGWGEDTWTTFCAELPAINAWIANTFPKAATVTSKQTTKPATKLINVEQKLVSGGKAAYMTMTGFRSPELKSLAESSGWVVGDLCKKTTHLVIKDATYENVKTAKARSDGIVVWTLQDALSEIRQ